MPSRADIALPLVALTAAILFVVIGGLKSNDISFFRAHASAWTAALLAIPALALFAIRAGRQPLGQAWRLWWTAGWVLIVIHLYWGLGRLHGWDLISVFERQGFAIAAPIFVLEIVWLIDVVLAWTRRDWSLAAGGYLLWQWLVWLIAVANFVVSLLVFRNDPASLWIGVLMAAVLGLAVLRRLVEGERA